MTDITDASHVVTTHPLDPLSAAEISAASALVRSSQGFPQAARFVSIERQEPSKEELEAFATGAEIERRAFLVIRDVVGARTLEGVVSLSSSSVLSVSHIPDVQPGLLFEDFLAVEELVRNDARWQDAMRKRGVTKFDHVMIEPWPCAYLGEEDSPTRRLNRPLSYVRYSEDENAYAHPVDNLTVLVDLDSREVLEVVDLGVVPVPGRPAEFWTPEEIANPDNIPTFPGARTDLKALEITQPDGPSFTVNGNEVSWQKWNFRVGFTPREGLVLHQLGYDDKGRRRSIAHRISLSEMVVPYADTAPNQIRKAVFDGGEDGLGKNANSLVLGCDCVGEIFYFDVALTDSAGTGESVKNAICLHEEDAGVMWKHTDLRTGRSIVRRSRRLVISQFMTLANYDYGFYWYLYQDGTIECEVKLTGIMSMGAFAEGEIPRHGARIAPGLYAPHHQHFFNARLDMAVDGPRNTVVEVDSRSLPVGPENPYGNAWETVSTKLTKESEAGRDLDFASARSWKIVNTDSVNVAGDPVSYKVMPGENAHHLLHDDAPVLQRAGFLKHQLWVTKFDASERFAAGDYPYQSPGGEGLPKYVAQDRSLENEDVVLWYTFGVHHITRTEDWPVMPVHRTGFSLKPSGFFDGNPALDLPESTSDHCAHHPETVHDGHIHPGH
ncbi:primary-amine oxidase [Subtercola frigoramans]|uniref:Amine oxidase n=1 Tax=Subtercola frigoramans TaxID=120298 RepID=A0ABS2L109_9MICO|nr:primary-amine oxidase [Subtercola frigoramans]MBM7470773.1 primary-amine oxidase [Subtercola frigoramans]